MKHVIKTPRYIYHMISFGSRNGSFRVNNRYPILSLRIVTKQLAPERKPRKDKIETLVNKFGGPRTFVQRYGRSGRYS